MKRITGNIVVKLALIAFSLFCVVTIITLQFKNNDLIGQIDDQNIKNAEAEENKDQLERENDRPFDEDYIVDYAKENLDLRDPEEIVFYNGN